MKRAPVKQNRRVVDDVLRPVVAQKKPRARISVSYRSLLVISVVLALISLIMAGYIINERRDAVAKKARTNKDDVTGVKAAISEHYTLPTDEEPALATVTDKDKLGAAFKGRAENNDRILIYQKNQTAILYRPSIDKVVGVVPVNIDNAPNGQKKQ